MKYLHTMVRVSDIDESVDFYCNKLGLVELRRYDSEQGRFTLVFLAAPGDENWGGNWALPGTDGIVTEVADGTFYLGKVVSDAEATDNFVRVRLSQ